MTIKQLQFFVELAHLKNLSRAATKLYITQPGLSYSIKQLENEIKTPLFTRHGSGVSLTHYGEIFLPYAESAITTINNGLNHIKELSNPLSGTLTLTFIFTLGENIILDTLNTFYSFDNHENIMIHLKPFRSSKKMTEFFENGLADIMISYTPPANAKSFILERQEIVLAVPLDHPLAQREMIALEDIANEPLVYPKKDTHLYKTIVGMYKSRGLEPHLCTPADDWISMLTYTSLGKGLSIIPDAKFQNDFVKVLHFEEVEHYRNVYMSISRSSYAQSNVVKYFYHVCLKHLGKDTPDEMP